MYVYMCRYMYIHDGIYTYTDIYIYLRIYTYTDSQTYGYCVRPDKTGKTAFEFMMMFVHFLLDLTEGGKIP